MSEPTPLFQPTNKLPTEAGMWIRTRLPPHYRWTVVRIHAGIRVPDGPLIALGWYDDVRDQWRAVEDDGHWVREVLLDDVPKARDAGALSADELVVACRNIGHDLTCPGCAEIFYTGSTFGGHTCARAAAKAETEATWAALEPIRRFGETTADAAARVVRELLDVKEAADGRLGEQPIDAVRRLRAEVERLKEALKPELGAWERAAGMGGNLIWRRQGGGAVVVDSDGWALWVGETLGPQGGYRPPDLSGLETGDPGKRAADLAARDKFRLAGGVFGEPNTTTPKTNPQETS